MSSRAGQGGKSMMVIAFGIAVLGLLPACTSLNTLAKDRCMEEKRSYLLGFIPTSLDSKFNKECAKMQMAENLAIQGGDPYMRAAGYGAMKRLNEELQKSDDDLVVKMVKGPTQMQCEFAGVDPQTKQAHYRNCKPVPSKAPKP